LTLCSFSAFVHQRSKLTDKTFPAILHRFNQAVPLSTKLKGYHCIAIPEGVTAVVEAAFHDNERIKSVTVPDSATGIEDCAFASCKSLTGITVPDSVTSIGY